VAVMAGPSERELDHVSLAHNDAELATQLGHQRPVAFPGIRRQPTARPSEARIAGCGEQVLDRNRQALKGTDSHPRGEGSIGRLSDYAGLLR